MTPFRDCAPTELRELEFVLCDLDDTLTFNGKLPAASYTAMQQLSESGKAVIVITGRPAGWCDLIARLWPVAGVVGENGAFYFSYKTSSKQMVRHFQRDDVQREKDQKRLFSIFSGLREKYPELELSRDQPYRTSDIAIDICEDVEPLDDKIIRDVVDEIEKAGATVKISSIHINAWIGQFSKIEMTEEFFLNEFGIDSKNYREKIMYIGDSPNDETMFNYFDKTVGVSNIVRFASQMNTLPKWITEHPGGFGFAEIAELLNPKN